ncbi:MAG: cell division protein FtsZ [Candidatus Methanomethylophilaceae archaeon]|nr:cell division protein FtsZ [Candidatus Methanomethylophilaceae archaeon]
MIGIGGAGCKVAASIYGSECPVDTIAINTHRDALMSPHTDKKIYICRGVLDGKGASGDADLGKMCAEKHIEEIRDAISEYDHLFLLAGLVGGTGSGALPVVYDLAKGMGKDVEVTVIDPFFIEGKRKAKAAEVMKSIISRCGIISLFMNDSLLQYDPKLKVDQAFALANSSISHYLLRKISGLSSYSKEQASLQNMAVEGVYLPLVPITA